MVFKQLVLNMPGVLGPKKHLNFNDKLKWTLTILILFFILSQIDLIGISAGSWEQLKAMQILLASPMGSIISLGIGPIVTASIILQLAVGSGLLPFNMATVDGKKMFQGTQKLLAIIFSLFESIAYVKMGMMAVAPGYSSEFVIFQLFLGGLLIIFMEEVVSKWGFGSGVGIFIVAGVSKEIVYRGLNIFQIGQLELGAVPDFVNHLVGGMFDLSIIMPIFTTLIVFAIVCYAQSMKIEIPLSMGTIRQGMKWPLKFIYTSNIPVILAAAFLMEIQLFARILYSNGIDLFGFITSNGLSLLNPPALFGRNSEFLILDGVLNTDVIFRAVTYFCYMVIFSILFSVMWVKTTNMGPKKVAEQIQSSGLQIPGFRRDPRIIEQKLEKYIPALAILGAAFVGALASIADFTGALGTGTGILLAVMIVYKLYEDIAKQHMEDMHPSLRKFVQF